MLNLNTQPRRAAAILLAVLLLGWAGWNFFGPGEMTSGSVSDVIGDWEPDPDGIDAAIARLGTGGQVAGEQATKEQKTMMSAHVAEQIAKGAKLSITADAVTTTSAGVSKTITCHLRAQPGHHVETYDPAQPQVMGIYFRTTSSGLLWWVGPNPIPMRRSKG